jgi:hypothetical protein
MRVTGNNISANSNQRGRICYVGLSQKAQQEIRKEYLEEISWETTAR